jgi:hypothetical protein
MTKNLGSTDKIVRVVLGIAISYFAYSTTIELLWVELLLYLISAILFLTTAFSICPLYKLFRVNTCNIK